MVNAATAPAYWRGEQGIISRFQVRHYILRILLPSGIMRS